MDVEFVSRETGWRHRGRPRQGANPEVVKLLERTYVTGTAAKLPLDPDTTEDDVRETVRQLRLGARELSKYLRIQPRRVREILAAREVRFFVEDAA